MNRLTRRSKVGEGFPMKHLNLMHMDTTSEDTLTEILERLAAYEDTGRGPEEISKHFDGYVKEIERLRGVIKHFEVLKHQERLIELPCKVGDKIYEANISRNIISTYKVTSIIIMTGSRNYNWELIEGLYSNLNGFNEDALGKKVFLTREEAEKALEVSND